MKLLFLDILYQLSHQLNLNPGSPNRSPTKRNNNDLQNLTPLFHAIFSSTPLGSMCL